MRMAITAFNEAIALQIIINPITRVQKLKQKLLKI